ncbi:MAG: hypothetical protein AB1416_09725 [Actinomycetota bacterium]
MDIQAEVARLVGDANARHKRLVEYVVRQVAGGRHLADVLDDPYVTNRSTPLERRALLEEPEVVETIGSDVVASLRARLEAVLRS